MALQRDLTDVKDSKRVFGRLLREYNRMNLTIGSFVDIPSKQMSGISENIPIENRLTLGKCGKLLMSNDSLRHETVIDSSSNDLSSDMVANKAKIFVGSEAKHLAKPHFNDNNDCKFLNISLKLLISKSIDSIDK